MLEDLRRLDPRDGSEWGCPIARHLSFSEGHTYYLKASSTLDYADPKEIWLLEPPSLSPGPSLRRTAEHIVRNRRGAVVIIADVHLSMGVLSADRFQVRSRAEHFAKNLRELRVHYPDVPVVALGASLGSLVVHLGLVRAHDVSGVTALLVSPPHKPTLPAELGMLLGCYRAFGLRDKSRRGGALELGMRVTFALTVLNAGLVVDSCYAPEHRSYMRRYWSECIRDGFLSPVAQCIEAHCVREAASDSDSTRFYRDFHRAVRECRHYRVLVDPEDRYVRDQHLWAGRRVCQIAGIGHQPLGVPNLNHSVQSWMLSLGEERIVA